MHRITLRPAALLSPWQLGSTRLSVPWWQRLDLPVVRSEPWGGPELTRAALPFRIAMRCAGRDSPYKREWGEKE
jgi:hypothetical protein